jgi:hypothetical protein
MKAILFVSGLILLLLGLGVGFGTANIGVGWERFSTVIGLVLMLGGVLLHIAESQPAMKKAAVISTVVLWLGGVALLLVLNPPGRPDARTSTPAASPVPSTSPAAALSPAPVLAPALPTPAPPVFLEQGGLVVMEAEDATAHKAGTGAAQHATWQPVTTFPGYAGVSALQALPNSGVAAQEPGVGPALLYHIAFTTTGTYYLALRGLVPGSPGAADTNNSVHVGVDGSSLTDATGRGFEFVAHPGFAWQTTHTIIDTAGGQAPYAQERTVLHIAEPGVHVLAIWMREDGVVLDRIVLSTSMSLMRQHDASLGPPQASQRRP